MIVLNPAQAFTTTFDVLLHEVAHGLLGHLESREPVGRAPMRVPERLPPPRHHPREVEANLATVLAGGRRGHSSKSVDRLYVVHFVACGGCGRRRCWQRPARWVCVLVAHRGVPAGLEAHTV